MMGNCIKRVRVWVLPCINPPVGIVYHYIPYTKLLILKKKYDIISYMIVTQLYDIEKVIKDSGVNNII